MSGFTRLSDGDSERLAEREVLLADREDDELFHLLLRRQVTGEHGLCADDLLGDLQIGTQEEPSPRPGDLDRLHPPRWPP